jgi:hypothetical protein
MNYTLLRLRQAGDGDLVVERLRPSSRMAFGVLPGRSHSGDDVGIIRSVTMSNADRHPTAQWVLRCLRVRSRSAYNNLYTDLAKLTAETQEAERTERVRALIGIRKYITNRHSMLIFKFVDDRGNNLSDYDLYLTAGPEYDEDQLPEGFFVDRQRNQRNPGKLTYYIDYDVMTEGLSKPKMQGRLGFRVKARPEPSDAALAYYRSIDFRSSLATINKMLIPNETVMIEITLLRRVDKAVFRITNDLTSAPIDPTPTESEVD